MAEPHVISALREKRAEVAGIVQSLEKQIAQRRADLAHVDATIRLFDPDAKPETIRAKRTYERNDWFQPGECARMVFDVLRDAPAPVTTADIAAHLMERKGIPADDRRTRELVQKTVLGTLNRAKGTIERVDVGGAAAWRVA